MGISYEHSIFGYFHGLFWAINSIAVRPFFGSDFPLKGYRKKLQTQIYMRVYDEKIRNSPENDRNEEKSA